MASEKDRILDGLDHPIFFSFVLTWVVLAWAAIITYAAKQADLPGLAAFAQHP